MIAKIAVSAAVFSIDKPYDYAIPSQLSPLPGTRVAVPFGAGNRLTEGIVLSVEDESREGLKEIAQVLDDAPVLSEELLHLAAFLRERYFCTFYEAIKTILPAGLWFSVKDTYRLSVLPEDWQTLIKGKKAAIPVVEYLQALGGTATDAELARHLPDAEQRQALLRYLMHKKLVYSECEMLKKGGDKTEKLVMLAVPTQEAASYISGHRKSAPLQCSVLELLCTVGCVCMKELLYFTGANAPTVRRLEKLGLVSIEQQPVLRRAKIVPTDANTDFVLNSEQNTVFSGLKEQLFHKKPGAALLYGVTGSGKTAIYINLIRACLSQKKSALLLVPEIALTPQLLSLLAACFGDEVAVLHSSLHVGERYDEYKRVARGEARVVVGTRSAVFAPANNLGLIILDEEQEHTYKSENTPRYHAREVALYRGIREGALVLFGSATPSVETMYRAKTGVFRLYTLKNRFNGKALPSVELVDMKQELRNGNGGSVSGALLEGIRENIENGKKSILLLNRRGSARLTVCVDCGYVPQCPNCSVSLTYHAANGRLMCHYCGYSQSFSTACPQCGGHMKQVGTGTQKAQQELQALLPGQEILRMDSDTVSAVHTHEKILSAFENDGIPVLLGTQMVAKGLNFEKVTLVGVLDADMSLYVDHFRAAETTFSLVTQVIGRAGRFDSPGRALIQTLTPRNAVLTLAAQQDYDSFYEMEIGLRRARNCPPFADMITIGFSGFPEQAVSQSARRFRMQLEAMLQRPEYASERVTLLGPAPEAVFKVNNRFRYSLTLQCENTRNLRQLLAYQLRLFLKDKSNRGVTAYADVNAY